MKLVILGSTGSIGTQALEVVRELKGRYDIEVVGISGNRNRVSTHPATVIDLPLSGNRNRFAFSFSFRKRK